MKTNRASRTAQMVAMGRAVAETGLSHVPTFSDPTARLFLNDEARAKLATFENAIRTGQRTARTEYLRVMSDVMALRTVAIDTAVRDEIARGATQLVILGAGYDGRAWRMKELAGVKVFEVDHPATQAAKRARERELPPPIGSVSFVPIDFERQALGEVLTRAGHDRSAPTCWIWEGVVMYLTNDAMRATLASVSGRSASGSTLIVNYHSEHRRLLLRIYFRLIGEPMISAWKPDEMAAELKSAGFVVREDAGIEDWNIRFANGQATVARAAFMRVAVAGKR